MTEFALVLPLMLLLLFGVIQFGIAFNNYLALTDAVRVGARKAAVSRHLPDPVEATVAKVQQASADLNLADLQVSVSSSWEPGQDVSVTASYPYSVNLLGVVVKAGRLTSTTTERVE